MLQCLSPRTLMLCMVFNILAPSAAALAEWKENADIAALFAQANAKGTFVLYDITASTDSGHHQPRAETRFIPASTFKIPNSLIGLAVGAVSSVDDIIPYKGSPDPFIKAWARDMGLRDAFPLSNVPIYQELARRIGLDRMQEHVTRMAYGNQQLGTTVDQFWLQGPLTISAIEQTRFLARLAQDALPFSANVQKSVRDIALIESNDQWQLYGKTGWQNAPNPGVGWWVGWVQKQDRIYTFALNIDILAAADASKRIELGRASLKILGIL